MEAFQYFSTGFPSLFFKIFSLPMANKKAFRLRLGKFRENLDFYVIIIT